MITNLFLFTTDSIIQKVFPVFEHKEIMKNIEKTRTRLLYNIVYINMLVKSNNSNKPKMFYALHAE